VSRTRFRKIRLERLNADTWEKTFPYPHRPVQMSKVCPQDSIDDRRFFDWLKTVGFEDTVVFELDRMAGYWTAINLFYETPEMPERNKALETANAYYDLIRNAWVTSQTMAKTRQSSAALLDRAAGAGSPTAVVGPNGELLENNDLFDGVLGTQAIKLSGKKKKLSFAHSVSVVGLDKWAQHNFLRHSADTVPLLLLASPFDPDPIFASKRENHWLLTCTTHASTARLRHNLWGNKTSLIKNNPVNCNGPQHGATACARTMFIRSARASQFGAA